MLLSRESEDQMAVTASSHLQSNWNKYEHRGTSTWEQVKGAVRDAWDRAMGRHTVGTR